MMFAGDPSSGKTEGIFAGVYSLDTLTENSFLSGYVDKDGKKLDKQFLDVVNGHYLLIKDLTTLFSMREDRSRSCSVSCNRSMTASIPRRVPLGY